MSTRLHAGTSGFAYPAWKPAFYPQKTPQRLFLNHYGSRLNSVEINYTFRRTAKPETFEKWVAQTPEGFLFSVKAHQRITHFKRLQEEADEPTDFFLNSLAPLRDAGRLGVVLFQLPPNLKKDLPRLERFLGRLPQGLRYAFEFRNESWLEDEVFQLLQAHNVCLCQAESDVLEAPKAVTADFVYLRLRKTEYAEADRNEIWAGAEAILSSGKSVFLYFKHEDTPEGALYAEDMLRRAAARQATSQ